MLLLGGFEFPVEGVLEGLPLLLSLAGGLAPQLLLLVPEFLVVPLLRIHLAAEVPDLLAQLLLLHLPTVQFPLSPVVFIVEGQQLANCLLVVFEENVIFDLEILGFGEFELGNAEVVLETRDFHLVPVHLPHIELDIVTGR